jgi:hypothetical protein
MDELQELIRRIKAKAAEKMVMSQDPTHLDAPECENDGAIGFCRELCDELNLDYIANNYCFSVE